MDHIQVVYSSDAFMITLGDHGVELTREEAEKLFIDLGHAIKDQDIKKLDEQMQGLHDV